MKIPKRKKNARKRLFRTTGMETTHGGTRRFLPRRQRVAARTARQLSWMRAML